jgi:hypothetical protein
LQELFVTLTRKIRTRLTAEQALRYLDQIDVEAVNPFRDRTKKR